MTNLSAKPDRDISALLEIMRRLRAPNGCPWDREQTFRTIAPYTIEEAYEVAAAIEDDDFASLPDELGDLLLQVVFHAEIASEAGLFDFDDVVAAIIDKLVRRHPHVFATANASAASSPDSAEAQKDAWETIKTSERAAKKKSGILDDVAVALPALLRAEKLQRRAASVGFDWENPATVVDKIAEEAREIVEAGDQEKIAEEVGDLLFSAVNLARHLKVDPEAALRMANTKFIRRFHFIESALAAKDSSPIAASLADMEELWQEAKAAEKTAAP